MVSFVLLQKNGEQPSKLPVIYHDLQQHNISKKHPENWQDEVISEEDLQAWETERQLQELQTAVNEEVDLKHPIEYNGHDICGLTKRGMLKSKFKVAQLKEICVLFGIEIEGPAGQKDSYVKPLEDLVQTCSCFKE